jgi:hypothetical protein
MRAPLTLRALRHMANESVIVAGAKRDRQESRTQGEGVGAGPPIGSGRRGSTPRIFSTKSESDQGSPLSTKRDSALVGDLMPPETAKTRAMTEARSKEGRFCKPLPKEFRHDGFTYRQIAREGDTAIYEQRWTGCAEQSVCYEVICIRQRAGFEIDGRFVEPAEVYPNSEAWGADGWTLQDKDAAFRKLREIVVERGISADELAIRLLISSQMEAE